MVSVQRFDNHTVLPRGRALRRRGVLLKPARRVGVIAGGRCGPCSGGGISDILTKSLGSNSAQPGAGHAGGLSRMQSASDVAKRRGISVAGCSASGTMRRHNHGGAQGHADTVIGNKLKAKRTIAALGLRRMHHTVTHTDTPQIRGMVFKVKHMVRVEETEE
jgi:large subunit ribosomal protein L30